MSEIIIDIQYICATYSKNRINDKQTILLLYKNNEMKNISNTYLNGREINFQFEYILTNQNKKINLEFKKQFTSMKQMFYDCKFLNEIYFH